MVGLQNLSTKAVTITRPVTRNVLNISASPSLQQEIRSSLNSPTISVLNILGVKSGLPRIVGEL